MKTVKSLSIYTLTGFVQKGIEFPLAIFLTHYLTEAEMGIMAFGLVYIGLFAVVLQIGATGAVGVEYFKKTPTEFPSYFSSALLSPAILLGVSVLVSYFFRERLSELMSFPAAWLPFLPFAGVCMFVLQVTLVLFRNKNLSLHFAIFNVSYSVLIAALSVLLVAGYSLTWEGRIGAVVATNAVFAAAGLFFINKWEFFTRALKKAYINDALRYGGSIVPFALSALIINFSDRFFIEKMIGMDTVGVYNVGYTIGSMILIVVTAFVGAFNPFLFETLRAKTERGLRKVALISYAFIALLGISVLVLTLVSPLLFRFLIEEKFSDGNQYVFWVAVAYFFYGIYALFSGQVHFFKKSKAILIAALMNVVLNLCFNYFFILHFGAMGATYATILSYLAVAIYTFRVARSSVYIPYRQFSENFKFLKIFLKENKVFGFKG